MKGSITIVDLGRGVTRAHASHLDFHRFDSQVDSLRRRGVRLFPDVAAPPLPPGAISLSQELEPEYIAIDPDGRNALVTLQEANARRSWSGVYDQWVRRSIDSLAILLPARYGKTEVLARYSDDIH